MCREPPALQPRELIEHGGLWSAFIFASTVPALLNLFDQRVAGIVRDMRAAVRENLRAPIPAFAAMELYDQLPSMDFSRDILQGQESALRVLEVAQCGWSDLGTPERVARVLRRVPTKDDLTENYGRMSPVSLATQHSRLQVYGGIGYQNFAAYRELSQGRLATAATEICVSGLQFPPWRPKFRGSIEQQRG